MRHPTSFIRHRVEQVNKRQSVQLWEHGSTDLFTQFVPSLLFSFVLFSIICFGVVAVACFFNSFFDFRQQLERQPAVSPGLGSRWGVGPAAGDTDTPGLGLGLGVGPAAGDTETRAGVCGRHYNDVARGDTMSDYHTPGMAFRRLPPHSADYHTPGMAFRRLLHTLLTTTLPAWLSGAFLHTARTGYAADISQQLSADDVCCLRKVRALIRLQATQRPGAHVNTRNLCPELKKEEEKFRFEWNDFGFIILCWSKQRRSGWVVGRRVSWTHAWFAWLRH